MAADTEVLLEYLDCSLAEFVHFWIVESRDTGVEVELPVQLFEEIGNTLLAIVWSNMPLQAIQLLDLVDVGIYKSCCSPSGLCWNIGLNFDKLICDNKDCVEPF